MPSIDPRICMAQVDGRMCGRLVSDPIHKEGAEGGHRFQRVVIGPMPGPTPWYIKLIPVWAVAGLLLLGMLFKLFVR